MENEKLFRVIYFLTSGELEMRLCPVLDEGENYTRAKIAAEPVEEKVIFIDIDKCIYSHNIEKVTFEGPYTREEWTEMYLRKKEELNLPDLKL